MNKKKTIKAWAVVTKAGEYQDISTIMSKSLRGFYNKTKTHMVLPCVITYSLPGISKRK